MRVGGRGNRDRVHQASSTGCGTKVSDGNTTANQAEMKDVASASDLLRRQCIRATWEFSLALRSTS